MAKLNLIVREGKKWEDVGSVILFVANANHL
jgi:hypothetical protein